MSLTVHHPFSREVTLETSQGQIDGFFSQLPFKCYLSEVASVGNRLKTCPWVASRAVLASSYHSRPLGRLRVEASMLLSQMPPALPREVLGWLRLPGFVTRGVPVSSIPSTRPGNLRLNRAGLVPRRRPNQAGSVPGTEGLRFRVYQKLRSLKPKP